MQWHVVRMYGHTQTACTHAPHRAKRTSEPASLVSCVGVHVVEPPKKRRMCWLSAASKPPAIPCDAHRGQRRILTICSSMKASPSSRPRENPAPAASAAGGGLDEAAGPPVSRSSACLLLLSSRSKSLKEKSPLPLLLSADDGLEKEDVCCRGPAVADDRKNAAAGGGVNACKGSSNICTTQQQQQERMKRARMMMMGTSSGKHLLVCRPAGRVPSKQWIPISLIPRKPGPEYGWCAKTETKDRAVAVFRARRGGQSNA